MAAIGERRYCTKCRRPATVVDQFTEADHGMADAQEWGVTELSCGHYLEGAPHAAVLCL